MKIRWIQLGLLLLVAASAPAAVSDASLDKTIAKSSQYLLKRIDASGSIPASHYRMQDSVLDALVAWALVESPAASAADCEKILRSLSTKISKRTSFYAFRILAYRNGSDFQRQQLLVDGAWLAKAQNADGGWGLESTSPSNQLDTAFAMYALQYAQTRGLKIDPKTLWGPAAGYLLRSQNSDGGFGYRSGEVRVRSKSYGSATAAGAVSLGVLVNRRSVYDIADREVSTMSKETLPPEIERYGRSITWLWKQFDISANPKWVWGDAPLGRYWLLAALSGECLSPMRLVEHDLDIAFATKLPALQNIDGSFGTVTNLNESRLERTACALIALSRARQPVLINKMSVGTLPLADYGDAWHLTDYASQTLRTSGTWRRVTVNAPLNVLRRSPMLLIAAGPKFHLNEKTLHRIHQYIYNGGVVVVQPLCGDPKIAGTVSKVLRRISDSYTREPLPATAKLLQAGGRLKTIKLSTIGDLSFRRIYVVGTDLGGQWHKGYTPARREAYSLICRLLPKTGQLALRKKFTLPMAAEVIKKVKPRVELPILGQQLQRTPTLGRAISRMSNAMASAISVGLKLNVPVGERIQAPQSSSLWIDATQGDLAKLRMKIPMEWVVRRNTLLVIDVGGDSKRLHDLEQRLKTKYPKMKLTCKTLPATHPLVTGKFAGALGCDLRNLGFGPAAAKYYGNATGPAQLRGIYDSSQNLRGVIVAVEVLSTLANGKPDPAVLSYKTSDDALGVALNLALYSYAREQSAL
ncbi:MAG: hypothetical protein HN909_00090 [Phycisphaerales bacterium]|jgi:hypothetical protein|nr:hypothetical protein [Phycisphaerales bacterium]MBT7170151.1 hypothetical protein [Phycisphaerales bacterium]